MYKTQFQKINPCNWFCGSGSEMLLFIFDEPHLIPAIGQFKGTVVPRPVIWGLLEFHFIFLEVLDQFLKLLVAVLTVSKASIGPYKRCEFCSVLDENIRLRRFGWVSLMFFRNVKGHSEGALTGRSSSRFNLTAHWCGHLHLTLFFISSLDVFEESSEACAEGWVLLHAIDSCANPVCCVVSADLIVSLTLLMSELWVLQSNRKERLADGF